MTIEWAFVDREIDWQELSDLYRAAPLGDKKPEWLKTAFGNSMFKVFLLEGGKLVGAGRAVADGVDCSYICDVAVLPGYQGTGLGRAIISKLVELSEGHRKIILYAKPGREGFYRELGFLPMTTAMAIFENQTGALEGGLVRDS